MRSDDYDKLSGVHPLLVATVLLANARYMALSPNRLRVTSGLRSPLEQRRLVAAGKSQTQNSRHLYGLAVDLAVLTPDRKQALWDFNHYKILHAYMSRAWAEVVRGDSQKDRPQLIWGGNWSVLRDGVHWEIMGVEPLHDPVLSEVSKGG